MGGEQLMGENERNHPRGEGRRGVEEWEGLMVAVTVPDCKTGSVTKIVPEKQGEEGETGEKGGLTSALADNTIRAVGQQ